MYHVVTMRTRDRQTYKFAYRQRGQAIEVATTARDKHGAVCRIAKMPVLPAGFPLGGGLALSI